MDGVSDADFKRFFGALLTIVRVVGWPDLPNHLKTILQDSDRGCILSMVESLNVLLERQIRLKFTALSGVNEKDLDFLLSRRPIPPLGSFGVRITLARALGLIEDDVRAALAQFQALRNDQAHSLISKSIREEKVIAVINQFQPEPAAGLVEACENWDHIVPQVCELASMDAEKVRSSTERPRKLLTMVYFYLMWRLITAPTT